MKTAAEVLDRIDEAIEGLKNEAAEPAIDALVDWGDREAYREAMKRAHGLKAVRALRESLAKEIKPEAALAKPVRRAR